MNSNRRKATSKKPSDSKAAGPSVLEQIKAQEQKDAIVLIMHDLDAMRVMKAWECSRVACSDRELAEGEGLDDAYEAIWEGVTNLNMINLARQSKLPVNTTVEIFERLRAGRLIYPDRTIHRVAKALMASEVNAYVKQLISAA